MKINKVDLAIGIFIGLVVVFLFIQMVVAPIPTKEK